MAENPYRKNLNPAVAALRDTEAAPIVRCAAAGCSNPANERVHGENLCRNHVEARHQRMAERYCDDMGLETIEQLKAFCKTRKIGASDPRAWIQDIITRYEAGEYRWRGNYIKACEAIGKEPVPWPA